MTSLLYSQSLSVEGIWNGGGTEVYTQGNEHYCLKADEGSTVIFELNVDKNNFVSCIYLTLGNVLAQECLENPSIQIENLSSSMYKIILAPQTAAENISYRLDVEYEGTFGRCSDYYQAGYLGMSVEDVNFLLGLSGLIVVVSLFGSLIYAVLTLGNF